MRVHASSIIIGYVLALLTICGIGLWNQAKSETWISFGGISHHYSEKRYNERNAGLGIEYDLNRDLRVMAGTYRNSYKRDSYYGGFGYTPIRIGPVSIGAVAGLFSGYVRKWTPVAMGAAFIEGERYGLNLLFLPPYKEADGLVALQFKVKW